MNKVKNGSVNSRQLFAVQLSNDDILKTDGKVHCCIIIINLCTDSCCDKTFSSTIVDTSMQTFIINNTFENQNEQSTFALELCQAMVESGFIINLITDTRMDNE